MAKAEVTTTVRPPRPELSRKLIVAAALDIARSYGLKAATMRAIARRAGGFEAMSLYTHVKSADHVRNLMLEAIEPDGAALVAEIDQAGPDQARALRAVRDLMIEDWAAGRLHFDGGEPSAAIVMLRRIVNRHTTKTEEVSSSDGQATEGKA